MYSVHDIKSYDIAGKGLPAKIEKMVRVCHMNYLRYIDRKIYKKYGFNIYISAKSVYRPRWWEKLKGRSGRSEHVFINMGGSDVTCDNFANRKNRDILLKHLIEHTDYTRIAIYKTFIHVDYKNSYDDRYVYKIVGGKWKRDCEI